MRSRGDSFAGGGDVYYVVMKVVGVMMIVMVTVTRDE